MKVIGYIRASNDEQDLESKSIFCLNMLRIDNCWINEFISAEVSSKEGTKERRIDELLSMPNKGDMLLVAELSRLGAEYAGDVEHHKRDQ